MRQENRREAIGSQAGGGDSQAENGPRGEAARAIPTGSAALDAALGSGGLPRGVIVELFGPAGSGKTSLALAMTAHCQAAGGSAVWVDADRSLDAAYAARLGVAIPKLPVARPDSAEQAFAMMGQLALAGAVDLLVADSAAALLPSLELEAPLGEGGRGLQSRVLGSGLRKLARTLARSGATAVFLNQTRSRPASAEGGEREEVSAGGPALKLYAAVRISLAAGGAGVARFRVLKNKAGEPFREGEARWLPTPASGEHPIDTL